MRIDKRFAPVTLTLEVEEDLSFLLEVLKKAGQYHMSSGRSFLSPRKYEDSFMQKCAYVERQLR